MPTLDDLHDAFAELEEQAPLSCHRALARQQGDGFVRTGARQRPWLLPALVAAVVLGVVTVAILGIAIGTQSRSNQQQVASSPPPSTGVSDATSPIETQPARMQATTYSFELRPLAGVTGADRRAGRDYQVLQLVSVVEGQPPVAQVLVYPVGGFVPARPPGAIEVRVGDLPGFSGLIAPEGPGMATVIDAPGLDAVAWEYVPGAWAIVQSGGPVDSGVTVPTLVQIAEAVYFSGTQPVLVPAQFGFLPAGLTPDSIATTGPPATRLTTIDFAGDGAARLGLTVVIGIDDMPLGGPAGRRGPPITLGTFTGYYDEECGSLYLTGGGWYVAIVSTDDGDCHPPAGSSLSTLDELTAILQGMTFAADPADAASWFEAAQAIPAN